MRSFPRSLVALSIPALLLAGCGQEKSAEAPAQDAASTANSTAESGPGISGVVAPGVAFRYDYAFTLPGKSISQVQQQHAAACQRLGPNRCRVTGMSYDQPGEDRVSARLDFLLAPDLAHSFGNEAISVVEKAEGKLENASVQGENAGDAIRLSQSDSAAIQAEIARLEARLAAKGMANAERVELQQQVAALREQLRGQAADRKSNEAAIATTPVSFAYASEGIMAGSGTFAKAASASWMSMESLIAFLSLVLGVTLPWILAIGGGVWIVRKLRKNPKPALEPAASE
jgi:Domain of unknown function (DUF4349)